MKILLLGSGGREHALAWKIAQSEKCEKLYIAPGNAGTADCGINIPMKADDFEVIKQFETDFASATYIVGHNVEFDKRIVGAEMIRLGKNDIMDSKKSFCTMKSSINLCKIPGYNGYKYPKLQELYKKLFAKEFEIAHDAMSDIEATKECFWELKKLKLI